MQTRTHSTCYCWCNIGYPPSLTPFNPFKGRREGGERERGREEREREGRVKGREGERGAGRLADRQTGRQTDRQTDRQRDKRTDRQTDIAESDTVTDSTNKKN